MWLRATQDHNTATILQAAPEQRPEIGPCAPPQIRLLGILGDWPIFCACRTLPEQRHEQETARQQTPQECMTSSAMLTSLWCPQPCGAPAHRPDLVSRLLFETFRRVRAAVRTIDPSHRALQSPQVAFWQTNRRHPLVNCAMNYWPQTREKHTRAATENKL